MRDDDVLNRRARMFDRPQPTHAGTGAPGRGLMDVPVRREPRAAVYESPKGRAMGAFVVAHDAIRGFAENRRLGAQNGVMDAIREQLEPGEEVRVFMGGFDFLSGTYDDVSIGDTGPALHSRETDVRTVVGGKPGDPGYDDRRPPSGKDFLVPSTGGWKLVSIPARGPRKSSPSEARPGRSEMKDWTDRWSRDPGLIDHDFSRADTISRTA